ncbi:MAG TPA: SBBP repeat-containing protein [Bryobacteraceae bacterium]|jgi:uncharacterized protein (TIGR03437 family)
MRFLLLLLLLAGVSFAGPFTTSLGDSYPYVISAITSDSAGNTYVAGSRQLATAGTVTLNSSTGLGAGTDVFVSKLDPSGNLLFTDTFAGKGVDTGIAIALDPSGNIYVGGTTTSPDFPLSEALQTQSNSNGTGFIIKLTNDGTTMLYSTYFGGALGASSVSGLATDATGNLYVTGLTSASDFVQVSGLPTAPLTAVNAFAAMSNVFVAELPAEGGKTLYSGEIAPTGNQAFATGVNPAPGIAVDSAGEVFLRYNNTFNSGFIAKINAAGAGFGFAPLTFPAIIDAIAVDTRGDAYFATYGGSIAKLDPTGGAVWTFILPGGGGTNPISLALDARDNVWATGTTSSTTFPNANGWTTGSDFLIGVDSSGAQSIYSALYPSSTVEQAVSVDPFGLVHVAGTNALVAALDPQAAPAKNIFAFQNAFGGNATARVSPTEVVAIYGPGIGPSTAVTATPANGFYPATLGGVEVSVNGTNIPLLYVSANQINAVLPMELTANSAATVRVTNGTAVSADYPVRIVGSSPRGNPAVTNQDGSINSMSNPAPGGSIVTFYVTGFQSSFAPLSDGQVATVANNDACALESGCAITAQTVAFFHLGSLSVPAAVVYAGAAPGIVAGVTQFNVQVGTPTGTFEFLMALNGLYGIGGVWVSPN